MPMINWKCEACGCEDDIDVRSPITPVASVWVQISNAHRVQKAENGITHVICAVTDFVLRKRRKDVD